MSVSDFVTGRLVLLKQEDHVDTHVDIRRSNLSEWSRSAPAKRKTFKDNSIYTVKMRGRYPPAAGGGGRGIILVFSLFSFLFVVVFSLPMILPHMRQPTNQPTAIALQRSSKLWAKCRVTDSMYSKLVR